MPFVQNDFSAMYYNIASAVAVIGIAWVATTIVVMIKLHCAVKALKRKNKFIEDLVVNGLKSLKNQMTRQQQEETDESFFSVHN